MASAFLLRPGNHWALPREARGVKDKGINTGGISVKLQRRREAQCSLRDKGLSKKPLWRTKDDMSLEAIQASASLRVAEKASDEAISKVIDGKVSRLLKQDLLALLVHLQRSNAVGLAIKVFDYARNEIWYRPELSYYYDMIYMLGRNKLIEKAEYYFVLLQEEGLQPETRIYTEMIGAYMRVGMLEKAMEMYTTMKRARCKPVELTLTILLKNLQRLGKIDLTKDVENDALEYLEHGDEFLRELRSKGSRTSS